MRAVSIGMSNATLTLSNCTSRKSICQFTGSDSSVVVSSGIESAIEILTSASFNTAIFTTASSSVRLVEWDTSDNLPTHPLILHASMSSRVFSLVLVRCTSSTSTLPLSRGTNLTLSASSSESSTVSPSCTASIPFRQRSSGHFSLTFSILTSICISSLSTSAALSTAHF